MKNEVEANYTLELTVKSLWTSLLAICILTGCSLSYTYLNVLWDVETMMIIPVFVVSSILVLLIPSYNKWLFNNKYFSNLSMWLLAMVVTFLFTFSYVVYLDRAPVLYSGKFFWEEGLSIEFRNNGKFKVRNSNLMDEDISYGNYELHNDQIILLDEVKFGMEKLNDTLLIKDEGIEFTLERPWRVSGGLLSFERKSN